MSYLQKASNNYFGFMPYNQNPKVGIYTVSSSEGSAISIGDVVTLTSIGTARIITGAFASTMLGVAASPLAANAGTTAPTRFGGDAASLLKVWDDPYQIFVTCDTTSGLIGSTGVFKNVAILSTGAVGDTGPIGLQSRMAISAITASSAGTMKVLGLHPVEDGFSTDANAAGVAASVRKLLVQPTLHFRLPGAAGTTGSLMTLITS